MVTKKVFNAILTAKDLRREKWKARKEIGGHLKVRLRSFFIKFLQNQFRT